MGMILTLNYQVTNLPNYQLLPGWLRQLPEREA
jgi:hypothetical protein